MMTKTYSTVRDAAAAAGVSRPTVYAWVRRGKVVPSAHDSEGRMLFDDEKVAELRRLAEASKR